jgi:hypothetical protein
MLLESGVRASLQGALTGVQRGLGQQRYDGEVWPERAQGTDVQQLDRVLLDTYDDAPATVLAGPRPDIVAAFDVTAGLGQHADQASAPERAPIEDDKPGCRVGGRRFGLLMSQANGSGARPQRCSPVPAGVHH